MDWKDYFPEHILERGYEYYENGRVQNVRITGDCVSAVVKGSENYNVEIDFDGTEIDPDMYCSCPHAEGGNNCKHMAAVLYEVEDQLWPDEANDSEIKVPDRKTGREKKDSISDTVHRADEELVRSFLTAILKKDENLALQFESLLNPAVSETDIEKYKKVLDKVLSRHGNRYGFLDWQEADSYCEEISSFLSQHVENLMDGRAYRTAFELSAYAFLQAAETEMDDSSGCLGELTEQISSIWEEIYEECDENTKAYLFDWCEKHCNGSVIDYMEEYIESFYWNHFGDPIYLKRKLAFTDKKLSDFDSKEKTAVSDYALSYLVRYRIQLMQDLDFDKGETEDFARQYWKLPEIREWMAAEKEKEGNTAAAIEIYEQSLKIDHNLPGLVRKYAMKLKELYKTTGREDAYCSFLWDLELKYLPGDPDIYREMKSYYTPEEWLIRRETVYQELPKYADRAPLYYEEGLYDRLLTCCLSAPGISVLRRYKKNLLKKYPDEVLNRFAGTVEEMAKRTGSRAHYRELVALLREIRQMPGGKEEIIRITGKWKELYRNRPAMMDELKKL